MEHGEGDPEITKTVTKNVFTVEQNSLMSVRAINNYNDVPPVVRLTHTYMVDISVNLWGIIKTTMKTLEPVDYIWGGYIPSTLPSLADTVDNIPRLTPLEKVYTDKVAK